MLMADFLILMSIILGLGGGRFCKGLEKGDGYEEMPGVSDLEP